MCGSGAICERDGDDAGALTLNVSSIKNRIAPAQESGRSTGAVHIQHECSAAGQWIGTSHGSTAVQTQSVNIRLRHTVAIHVLADVAGGHTDTQARGYLHGVGYARESRRGGQEEDAICGR